METIKGFIEHFAYRNEENGYSVMTVVADGKSITCVGTVRGYSEGETIAIDGEFVIHPIYDKQLKITAIRSIPPEDRIAIVRYLGSGAIKGIGEALANRIVDFFGEDTFRVIEEEPERLVEVKGISARKAREITNQLVAKRDMRDAMIFLQKYGIGQELANKIYLHYRGEVFQIMKENPYRLVEDINGIGFRIADEMAMKAGICVDSDYRIRCGLLYTLMQTTADGNCYYPQNQLLILTAKVLGLQTEYIKLQLDSLIMDQKVIAKTVAGEERIYLTSYYKEEVYCAKQLLVLRDTFDIPREDRKVIQKQIEQIEEHMEMQLDELQRQAVVSCVENGVFLLSGGPGTGKTTTINVILKYFELEELDFVLAAPTGRAAKRMTETTGYEAKTIHRLLEINGDISEERKKASFERNEDNPLEVDAVIIDEVSMVDIHLLKALLAALIPGTKLILVGDVDQLPSVGPGQVLRDVMESERFCAVRLERIFRQAQESHIVSYAHKINKGEMIDFSEKYKDFFLLEKEQPEVIYQYIHQLMEDILPRNLHIKSFDVQVLTPMRKGALGVDVLNRVLQGMLNPPSAQKAEHEYGDKLFRVGDKIMQIRNNYNLEWEVVGNYNIPIDQGKGVFNGDVGLITEINTYLKTLTVKFEDGRIAMYPFSTLDELELAYAITIHKSQGSEYPAIILPVLTGPKMLLNRNLLYTGVTRARNCVIILGSSDTIREMIRTDHVQERYTSLRERIGELDL